MTRCVSRVNWYERQISETRTFVHRRWTKLRNNFMVNLLQCVGVTVVPTVRLLVNTARWLYTRTGPMHRHNSRFTSKPALARVSQSLFPLLYLVYTNNILIAPKETVAQYVDDTIFLTKDRNPIRVMIYLWRLRINSLKNHYDTFRST